jgi:hypothetical protein
MTLGIGTLSCIKIQTVSVNHWDGSGDLQQFLETSTWFQIYEV